MAKESGIEKVARVDMEGALEGHGTVDMSATSRVKKGKFMQVGSSVDLMETAYSPNRKSGTSSGTGEY